MKAGEAIEREPHEATMMGWQRTEGTNQVEVFDRRNRLGMARDWVAQPASQRKKRDLLLHHDTPGKRT